MLAPEVGSGLIEDQCLDTGNQLYIPRGVADDRGGGVDGLGDSEGTSHGKGRGLEEFHVSLDNAFHEFTPPEQKMRATQDLI